MGSSHSVLLGSQKREDMSCCDIEHKHGKTWTTLVPRGDHLSLTSGNCSVCSYMQTTVDRGGWPLPACLCFVQTSWP